MPFFLTTRLKICFYAFVLVEEVPMVPMLPDKIPIVGRSKRDLMFFTNKNNKRKLERVKKPKRNRELMNGAKLIVLNLGELMHLPFY